MNHAQLTGEYSAQSMSPLTENVHTPPVQPNFAKVVLGFSERTVLTMPAVQASPRGGSNGPGERLDAENAADEAIAPKLGCSFESLRVCCEQVERDTGQRAGLTSAEKDRSRT